MALDRCCESARGAECAHVSQATPSPSRPLRQDGPKILRVLVPNPAFPRFPAFVVSTDPPMFHEVFTADLPRSESDVLAVSQRPVAVAGFAEKNAHPAWKDLPSWAAVGTEDKAAGTDAVMAMAERAGATITEIPGSHVIMISQPDAVTEVILTALRAVSKTSTTAVPV